MGIENLKVVARHSAKSKSHFNCFLSDLDLSIVFKSSTNNSSTYLNAIKKIRKLKSFLPFLGEVELYTEMESKGLSNLLAAQNKNYNFIRNLRKLTWIKKFHLSGQTEYHRFKASRSLDLIRKNTFKINSIESGQLEMAIGEWCNINFYKELDLIQDLLNQNDFSLLNEVYSDFLGYFLQTYPSFIDREQLVLEKKYILMLLALAPEDHHIKPEVNQVVALILKVVPSLKAVRQDLAKIEALVVQSWARTQDPVPDWAPAWIKRLLEISVE